LATREIGGIKAGNLFLSRRKSSERFLERKLKDLQINSGGFLMRGRWRAERIFSAGHYFLNRIFVGLVFDLR
jgi:hypothetical protein